MDPLSLINNTIEIANNLKKMSTTIADTELKMMLSELYNNLADAKMEVARLKNRNQELETELARIKSEEFSKKPKIHSGCYQFDNDDNLYCIACYEKNKRKSPAFKWENIAMVCSVCNQDTPLR